MTDATRADVTNRGGIAGLVSQVNRIFASIPQSLPMLVLRVALAVPFLKSGLTKWDGFLQLKASQPFLFQEEFKLHIFGGQYNFPAPGTMAFLAASAEIVLPILLVLGLGTRFAAFGLLIMTGVIQLVYPEAWSNFHLPWAAMALAIVVFGAGKISVDHVIGRSVAGNR